MFRPLGGHHQTFLKQVVKKLRTLLGSQLCWDPNNVRSFLTTCFKKA